MAAERVFIAEKPSVAQDFAKALHENFTRRDGYMESEKTIVTWCFGHLVTMSYPEAYDPKYKKWSLDTIPFIPDTFKYEVINDAGVKKQYKIVKGLLTSKEIRTIYICTDSGREGEYIYRLVATQAGVKGKQQLRVWIDSFTEAEIARGIREAKDDSAYDNMGAAAYLRAKEDYLMGINFSRALSLKYARGIGNFLGMDRCVIAVGRVMTCVLGMIVRREREIRAFVKTPFYRVVGTFSPAADHAGIAFTLEPVSAQTAANPSETSVQHSLSGPDEQSVQRSLSGLGEQSVQRGLSGPDELSTQRSLSGSFEAEWSAKEGSKFFQSPLLYKENGFREEKDAKALIDYLQSDEDGDPTPFVKSITHKQEKKNAPLLYNLAELQNDCSRFFKLSPDQTLDAAQTLYERKLTTYPRTDARVLSTAVAKEIDHSLKGVSHLPQFHELVRPISDSGSWKTIAKTRYTNDKAITDHYAIIPTGEGLQNLKSLNPTLQKVYALIVRRFLSIFYPPAVFDKMTLQVGIKQETLTASLKVTREKGYLACLDSWKNAGSGQNAARQDGKEGSASPGDNSSAVKTGASALASGRIKDAGQFTGESEDSVLPEGLSETEGNPSLEDFIRSLKKGDKLTAQDFAVKEGETSPPKRYSGGSMILAMENAGQLIEDEELREQIKGSGIGTSATRAGILEKLVKNQYISLNTKTQIYTPTQLGEMIYDCVDLSIRPLLEPKLTASWEKGLTQVAEGTTTEAEYQEKLNSYVIRRTNAVKASNFGDTLQQMYRRDAAFYPKAMHFSKKYTYTKRPASAGRRT